jgi:hypothetical protein
MRIVLEGKEVSRELRRPESLPPGEKFVEFGLDDFLGIGELEGMFHLFRLLSGKQLISSV